MLNLLTNLFGGRPPGPARAPDGVRLYAVGDVHGRADLLARMLELIAADQARAAPMRSQTIFLGDYVDRGPDSRGVLDLLCAASQAGALLLLGNHEAMLLEFLHNPETLDEWGRQGGLETLNSYGVKAQGVGPLAAAEAFAAALPAAHLDLLGTAGLTYAAGDYFFCHAGVRPGVPLEAQTAADLLWIRREFIDSNKDFGKVVVHGHTPGEAPDVRPNRIGVDTGAYVTGRLTCVVLEGAQRRFLTATRRI